MLPQLSTELPGSIRIAPIYDRSLSIVHSVADVQTTLVIAFVLVVIVVFVTSLVSALALFATNSPVPATESSCA